MRFQQVLFCIVTLLTAFAVASPLPSFEDIERRWIKGESEAQIHANHHIREASPAWLVDRGADAEENEFSFVPDKRTLETRRNEARSRREASVSYRAMKNFVNNFMRKAGKGAVVAKRSAADEAPVLKPKKSMRYYFTS